MPLQIGSHLLFLHNLHPWLHSSIDGPNWSVAAEMQFYVLAIVAVPLLSRVDVRWLVRRAESSLAWSFRALAYLGRAGPRPAAATFIYATQVPSMLDAFAIGICIARLHLDGTVKRWSARSRPSPVRDGVPFVVALYFGWDAYWAHCKLLGKRLDGHLLENRARADVRQPGPSGRSECPTDSLSGRCAR